MSKISGMAIIGVSFMIFLSIFNLLYFYNSKDKEVINALTEKLTDSTQLIQELSNEIKVKNVALGECRWDKNNELANCQRRYRAALEELLKVKK
jgi:hypothetical protein